MPVAARCPSCAAPLSETSVLALAPLCTHCGVVITSVGGTLGLTGAYGVSDLTITRRRVEADLAVFREYQEKYRGMKEACIQQLNWGVERYAQLPQSPELLTLKKVPDFWAGLGWGLVAAAIWFVVSYVAAWIFFALYSVFMAITHLRGDVVPWSQAIWIEELNFYCSSGLGCLEPENFIVNMFIYGGCVAFVLGGLFPHFRVRVANGDKPRENARRQKAHEEAVAAALKVAEPLKAAQDHRLRSQIRELESLVKTIGEKEAEVRRLLATH